MLQKPKNLTSSPGVYLFKDAAGAILYIGKAKNIADRIASYFNGNQDYKTMQLQAEASSIETIPTNSEIEALYLEAELIKKYQPKYNSLLKEGNPFIYLLISDEEIPTISMVRTKSKKGTYIGPFLSKKAAYGIHSYIIKQFSLKLCSKKIPQGCLQYHIGICSGYCKDDFDPSFHIFKINLAKQLLTKNIDEAVDLITHEIQIACKALLFERAKNLSTYKQNLASITQTLQRLADMPSKQEKISEVQNINLLMAIQKRLALQHIPYVIDCFDISHFQGTFIVGSCIRYAHGVPQPKSFRRFKIKSLIDQNDYAALAEIVQRRYKSGNQYPNLIIVDGGKGQINAIKPYIGTAELVGLAKREETIISADFNHIIKLDPRKPEDALILQIRDKTHQFAISYHRKKREFT